MKKILRIATMFVEPVSCILAIVNMIQDNYSEATFFMVLCLWYKVAMFDDKINQQ